MENRREWTQTKTEHLQFFWLDQNVQAELDNTPILTLIPNGAIRLGWNKEAW